MRMAFLRLSGSYMKLPFCGPLNPRNADQGGVRVLKHSFDKNMASPLPRLGFG